MPLRSSAPVTSSSSSQSWLALFELLSRLNCHCRLRMIGSLIGFVISSRGLFLFRSLLIWSRDSTPLPNSIISSWWRYSTCRATALYPQSNSCPQTHSWTPTHLGKTLFESSCLWCFLVVCGRIWRRLARYSHSFQHWCVSWTSSVLCWSGWASSWRRGRGHDYTN